MNETGTPKVSIIMPVFNTVHYIRECLDSLVSQTLRDIEILCVDADSTDGTREILEEYVKKDGRVRLLRDTKKSTGYANNLGMEQARGQYLAIVEPDDYVAADMYERLYTLAKEYQADAVRADYKVFFGDAGQREYFDKAIASPGDYGRICCPASEQRLFQNDMSTWAGICARELFERGKVCHNETPGAAYQDNGFWFLMMAHVKRLYYASVSGYRYRLDNPASSVHDRKKLFAICEEYDFIERRLRQEGIFEPFERTFLRIKFIRYLSAYYRLEDALKPEFAVRFAKELKVYDEEGRLKREDFTKGQRELLEELLEGGAVFYRSRADKERGIRTLLESGEKAVLFGCGSDGLRLLSFLRENNYLDKIMCLCDNNSALWSKKILGKEVLPPEKAWRAYPAACYLIASVNYGEDIKKQLREKIGDRTRIYIADFC